MSFTPLSPKGIRPPFGEYAHGVEIRGPQRIIRTSGQLGIATDESIPETVKDQAALCFANIDAILAEGQMGRSDIAHITAFVTDRAHMKDYMAARDTYLEGIEKRPASTLLIVSGFTREEFLVEIEVLACSETSIVRAV